MAIKHNLTPAEKRKRRIRSRMHGTADKPRLSVFRSNRYIYLQAINDDSGETVASSNDVALRRKKNQKKTKTETAELAAVDLADKLKKKKIKQVVLDRGPYRYHGRVKAVAEALRENGVKV